MSIRSFPYLTCGKAPGLLTASALALATLGFGAQLHAQVSELGAAANYAGLELSSSNIFTISSGNTIVTGDIGLAAGGTLNFSGGGQVTGEIDAGSGSHITISGGSVADGGTVTTNMSSAITDAANAATYYSGLTATQSFSSITASKTITGTGGMNVIAINGDINLQGGSILTLSGSSTDQFVIDVNAAGVSGNPPDLTLGGGSSIVLNGISANQVVFNLIGTGLQMTTNGNSDYSGYFLAENGGITVSGGVENANYIAGGALTFQSGPHITQAAAALAPVPELSSLWMSAGGLTLIAGLGILVKTKTERAEAAAA